MIEQSPRPTVPPWLYKLFTGHQYPYVRRQAKFANRDFKPGEERPEPTRSDRCQVLGNLSAVPQNLEEVKAGMIVVFHELGEYRRAVIRTWWMRRRISCREVRKKKIKSEFL